MWKGAEVKKTKKLTHNEIRRKLTESLVINDTTDADEFNKKVEEVEDPETAADTGY